MILSSGYKIVVHWNDEEQVFTAVVPELPGCAADGSSHREARLNAERVIRQWLDVSRVARRESPRRRPSRKSA